jgi:hypothetical protein
VRTIVLSQRTAAERPTETLRWTHGRRGSPENLNQSRAGRSPHRGPRAARELYSRLFAGIGGQPYPPVRRLWHPRRRRQGRPREFAARCPRSESAWSVYPRDRRHRRALEARCRRLPTWRWPPSTSATRQDSVFQEPRQARSSPPGRRERGWARVPQRWQRTPRAAPRSTLQRVRQGLCPFYRAGFGWTLNRPASGSRSPTRVPGRRRQLRRACEDKPEGPTGSPTTGSSYCKRRRSVGCPAHRKPSEPGARENLAPNGLSRRPMSILTRSTGARELRPAPPMLDPRLIPGQSALREPRLLSRSRRGPRGFRAGGRDWSSDRVGQVRHLCSGRTIRRLPRGRPSTSLDRGHDPGTPRDVARLRARGAVFHVRSLTRRRRPGSRRRGGSRHRPTASRTSIARSIAAGISASRDVRIINKKKKKKKRKNGKYI